MAGRRDWNPDDPALLFYPRQAGDGFGVNFYWILHPPRRWRVIHCPDR